LDALRPTFGLIDRHEEDRRRRLAIDLRARENALEPRPPALVITDPFERRSIGREYP
jgi:hypothetical protein